MPGEMDFIGRQIGNYQVESELSRGGFGSVYLARHTLLKERAVAIKFLHAFLSSPEERDQFLKEALFLETLKHHSILPLLDVGLIDGFPYLITEYALGGNLRTRLITQVQRGLPTEECITILTQVGMAVAFAHQHNVVHRDLKPENILFNGQGDALLADFGIAVVAATANSQMVSSLIGTPQYMSPEQFQGKVSKESDQYALGCIAYELFTGHPPFSAPNFIAMGFLHATMPPEPLSRYNPALPPMIEQAVQKALAKQRTERHPDVLAFVNALQSVVQRDTQPPTALAPLETPTSVATIQTPPTLGTPEEQELAASEQKLALHPNADNYNRKGNALYALRRYEEALQAYEEALRQDACYAIAYNNKGLALKGLQRPQEALQAFDMALQLDPNYVPAHSNKAWVLNDLDRHDEALAACERALNINPNHATSYNRKGNALLGLHRYEEALEAYEDALRLSPRYATGHHNKGLALHKLGRYEEALAAYNQALRFDPVYVTAFYNKGTTLNELKRHEEALAMFEEAVRIRPNYALAYHSKAWTLNKLRRYEEALVACDDASCLNPKDASILNLKGNAFYGLKRYNEALKAYDEALRCNPRLAVAYNNKGKIYNNLKQFEDALEMYTEALLINPDYALAHHGKGLVLNNLKRPQEARIAFDKARELGYLG